ncbi:hypothetical protein [Facklamia sp. 7083-14-GEN3]|uniref:hypothetical protein n=1 Tax=Facklamia sp. 7083-14-GEN3 TaxID=2973478 RepID=UPI00215C14EE|nr:hypothetical protein [Facklamia sp. 7083-14-GEN3]MCR8969337.1 hypothetical protein [Facklamia sp. 7083-14-GEN3]
MKNKKGLILPMVLCFMMLSQVIYLGVIQLNALHRQRIHQSNNYYQLQIQTLLADSNLRPILQDQWTKSLEESLQRECQLLQKESLNDLGLFTSDSLIQTINLIEVETLDFDSLLLLYKTLIFIEKPSNFEPTFSIIEADGEWVANDQVTLFPNSSKEDSFDASHLLLSSQGYLINKGLNKNKKSQWVGTLEQEFQIEFNTGTSKILTSGYKLIFDSRLSTGESFEKKQDLPQLNYLLQWHGNLYQDSKAS